MIRRSTENDTRKRNMCDWEHAILSTSDSNAYTRLVNRTYKSDSRANLYPVNASWRAPSYYLPGMHQGRGFGVNAWRRHNLQLSAVALARSAACYPDKNIAASLRRTNHRVVPGTNAFFHLGNNPYGEYLEPWLGDEPGSKH